MVGVGGRSKACENCRRRRVKCDLARPICLRCQKARLQCSGPREIAIVPYKSPDTTAVSSTVLTATQSKGVTDMSPELQIGRILTVPHDDIYLTFTHSHLLNNGIDGISVDPGIDRAVTDKCFLALSTTYFGIKHRETAVTSRGLRRYGAALQTVHEALADDNLSKSFDVLEAVMIMAVIEFLVSERENGWIHHARGLERLLQKRGPKRMSSLPSLLVFERCRASMIFAALVLRKPTIVASYEWKTLPWAQFPCRVHSLKLLTDIMADCPELFVIRDQMSRTESQRGDRHMQVQSLLDKARDVLHDLHQWEYTWNLTAGDAYTEVPPPAIPPASLGRSGSVTAAWTSVFRFQSLYHANALTLYNATLILILRFLASIRGSLPGIGDCEAIQQQIRNAGLFICRSANYHLDQAWTELGTLNMLFPLRMAYEAVGREDEAIGFWLRNILKDISAGRSGLWRSAKSVLEL